MTDLPTATREPLMGLATLMTMAFRGTDLRPLAQVLIDRAGADEHDAEALMDLSTALFLQGLREVGLATQAQALQVRRDFRLEAPCPCADGRPLRLLALMMPGDLMTNAPLPFLCEGSDIELTMLYLMPGEALPETLPAHDVLWTAVSESAASRALLARLDAQLARRGLRSVNRPGAILDTSRDAAWLRLQGVPGLTMPATTLHERARLQELAEGTRPLGTLLPDAAWPLIVRPLDSHAGHDLEKVDTPAALAAYLEATAGNAFYLSRFIDYRGADGQFRKYRVVLVDGQAFAGHLGVSSHWMVHYLNAGMTDSEAKRRQEAEFMSGFDDGFGARHAAALAQIGARFGLDYLVIDCAETPDGRLLVFEVDPGAVVHSMDPEDMFPYKHPAMRRVRQAFRSLLARRLPR
ncbi:MAG: hypothetical protein RLZZ592_940 [Pseudomonadota bacterium]|jgi:glutathione synthase/RimK-type ligase-like ATP-grasp enzyme|nr:hypothetical protein [Pseudomonadota bacterium]